MNEIHYGAMRPKFDESITADDWCRLVDIDRGGLTSRIARRIAATRSNYHVLGRAEQDEHVLRIFRRLTERGIVRTTQENINAFEAGWDENLQLCLERGVSAETLRPKYVKPHPCIRYRQMYVAPENALLANDLLGIAVAYYAEKYLSDVTEICEYGCGTGRFLFDISEMFPNKRFVGLDWTRSTQKILELMAQTGRHISGIRFDMLQPDSEVRLGSSTAVVTIGALEQLGDRFQPFLDYLLANRPAIVVHLEPIADFYDEDVTVDYMAALYHRQRRYLCGYLPALQALQRQRRIEILEARRLFFGDPYHESSSCIVWKPNV